ncbi:MAG TPA: NAD(P)H-dependent glycerol-3-phosphate dehydrogenase [Casimicrobiaceae bacterium]|nr:NAD(P)H-dependent glycerol-3-phosphate dehydrogenase [Casimicrobiaceae bacterium]
MTPHVAVLGGGAWGTAFAVHLAARTHAKPRVTLYVRDAAQARATIASRENRRYLPNVALPADVAVVSSLADLRADLLFAATPVAELGPLAAQLADAGVDAPLVSLAKGFVAGDSDPGGWTLSHRMLASRWPHGVGAISGPTFAVEVARGLPTALVVATTDPTLTDRVLELVRGEALRAYASDDLTGVELGGAIKNVFAIAAGASDGLRFGDNARAALITRGLAEAGRLSAALGGRAQTLMGLAGLGDLVLTCTGNLSRNRRVGLGLARGQPLAAILAEIGHVAEGVAATRAARELALHYRVDMPIVDAVHRVLYEGVAPNDAVLALLAREPRDE